MMNENFIGSELEDKSADSNEAADSLSDDDFEKLESEQKDRKEKQTQHKKIEEQERLSADLELEENLSELSSLDLINKEYPNNEEALSIGKEFIERNALMGIIPTEKELEAHISDKLGNGEKLSQEDEIKALKNELESEGKSSTEILQNLISRYDNVPEVKTWVENWKNFLELHELAKSKSPTERKAIETIISNSDFTTENAFETALESISNNSEISAETKEEISLKFGKITSVGGMDSTLNQLKDHKKGIEKAISEKGEIKESLEGEISDLKSKIENTEPFSTERKELEKQLEAKTKNLKVAESEIRELQETIPKEISFPLREGFTAKLNSDGSRVIRIDGLNFDLKIPDNKMPFQGQKNMLAINLAFNYSALHMSGMEGLFNPPLGSGDVPDKNHRILSGKILSNLGYPTDTILSNDHIKQLKDDLGILKQKGSNSTGMEDATALGIYDISTQEINMNRLTKCLSFIKQNRGKGIGFEEIKKN